MSTQRIVLATGNPGKVRELQQLLADMDCEIVPQSEFDAPEAIEDGLGFVENALIKARSAARHTGLRTSSTRHGIFDAHKSLPVYGMERAWNRFHRSRIV